MKATRLPPARAPRTPFEIPDEVALRALRRFEVDEETGCHISTYSTASHGYAQIGWKGDGGKMRGTTAHRAAWCAVFGQIPQGMTIDHICKNRRCVNVAHLRLLSNFENARRTDGRDWPIGQCANGHPNSELVRVDGGRKLACRICHGERARRRSAKRRSDRNAKRRSDVG